MGHFPHGGIGFQLLDHIGQIYRDSTFQAYDMHPMRNEVGCMNFKGADKANILRYGQTLPPEINFQAVGETNIPIHVFSCSDD